MKNHAALLALVAAMNSQASDLKIDAAKAAAYVGQNVIACGEVTQVKRFAKGVYLNFGPDFPRQYLTGVIWAEEAAAFNRHFAGLDTLKGRSVCLQGKVETYKRHPQIQLTKPTDVSVTK